LEHHFTDLPFWSDLVTSTNSVAGGATVQNPIIQGGFINVPESPGLGIDFNKDVIVQHLFAGEDYFPSADYWDSDRSWDRLWS
jgi:L-alanine-DL-glutamate epimerase-like enolase superfamily enzyme